MEYLAMKLERKGQLSILKAFFFFLALAEMRDLKQKGKPNSSYAQNTPAGNQIQKHFVAVICSILWTDFFFFLFSYMSWRTSSYLVFTNLRFPVFFLLLFSTITSFLLSPFVFAPFSVFLRENKNSLASQGSSRGRGRMYSSGDVDVWQKLAQYCKAVILQLKVF